MYSSDKHDPPALDGVVGAYLNMQILGRLLRGIAKYSSIGRQLMPASSQSSSHHEFAVPV